MEYVGYGKAGGRSPNWKNPKISKITLCSPKYEKFINKSCTGRCFCQLYLMFEELLARAILKLVWQGSHSYLEGKGNCTALIPLAYLLHSFLPSLVQTTPALCCLQSAPSDEVQVDMRCSTAGQLPLTEDSWPFCVYAWDFLAVVGIKPSKSKAVFEKQELASQVQGCLSPTASEA